MRLARKLFTSEDPAPKTWHVPDGCNVPSSESRPLKENVSPWGACVLKFWVRSTSSFGLQRRAKYLCKGPGDGTWHVARGTERPATGTIVVPAFRRIERCRSRPDRPSRRACRPANAWTDTHTDRLTNRRRPTFFQRPPRGNFRKLKLFELQFSPILN